MTKTAAIQLSQTWKQHF